MSSHRPDGTEPTTDPTEQELHAALRTAGESVHPTDRLGAIRARTQGATEPVGPSWWNRPWLLAAGTGVVAASVVTAAVVLTSTTADDPLVSDDPPPEGTVSHEVTIYEVGEVGGRPWLFPETVPAEGTGQPAEDAVRALLESSSGEDRTNLWATLPDDVDVTSVRIDADSAVVDLTGLDPAAGVDGSWAFEPALGAQQLVWTVQAALHTTVIPVVVTVDGEPVAEPLLDGVVPTELTTADPSVLSPVLIETPIDGASVASPVRIRGTSDTFEANVVWEVAGQDGGVAQGGTTMGGTLGNRRPFTVTVDLPPGTYTFRAYADDMETGGVFAEDAATFTVE